MRTQGSVSGVLVLAFNEDVDWLSWLFPNMIAVPIRLSIYGECPCGKTHNLLHKQADVRVFLFGFPVKSGFSLKGLTRVVPGLVKKLFFAKKAGCWRY